MSDYYIGTCSFTYQDLLGTFYPPNMKPAERISWYARHFNVVEIDSSFYGLPSERNSYLFGERTPDDFVFHFKAFGLLTQHPVPNQRLGRALAAHLPPGAEDPVKDPPPDLLGQAFEMFQTALMPLHLAGKLGCILFQYPPYYTKSDRNMEYIVHCRDMLPDYQLAIEFRHGSWVQDPELEDTMEFLRKNGLTYVCVDEPQFPSGATVPPIAKATNDIAYVRFHGRNAETWYKRGITVGERFDYRYGEEELKEWVPKIKSLAAQTRQTHLLFNNCRRTYPIENARELADLLEVLQHKQRIEIFSEPQLDI